MVSGYLDVKNLANSRLVCHQFKQTFFRRFEDAKKPAISSLATQLLRHTMKGEETKVSYESLKTPAKCIYWQAALETCQGKNLFLETCEASPLQYAAWVGDTQIVKAFLKDMPNELKPKALEQLREVLEKGIKVYKKFLNRKHEPYLEPLDRLIETFTTYRNHMASWPTRIKDEYWCKDVKYAQMLVPVIVLQWFCSKGDELSRTMTLANGMSLQNYVNGSHDDIHFPLFKINTGECAIMSEHLPWRLTTNELEALTQLRDKMKNELQACIAQLECELTPKQAL